ncbi:MAG: SgcJ/EcaC family oxidoreductase [Acidobacteria bacterium]|nr:SgcJ/EcaC family oxidoreductase [Acidobacteriota bacterium]
MSTTTTSPQPAQKRDIVTDLEAIGALHASYVAAFNSNDAAAVAAFYTDHAVLMLPGVPAIEGRRDIQAMFEAYFKENVAKISHNAARNPGGGRLGL